jgi:hypothetical protein
VHEELLDDRLFKDRRSDLQLAGAVRATLQKQHRSGMRREAQA